MKNLTLSLNATDIAHAVKSDTYITGQIDKSADMVKNAALAYNEQAGDESYHNMKLYRTMKGALAKLEASIAEYVETSNQGATITDTLTSSLGAFTITISVGDRTSGAFVTTLAYLSQEYVINTMLYYWWQPIKPSLAKDYVAFASDNLLDIKRCLAKSAPSSSATYDDISGNVQAQSSLSFPLSEYNAQVGQAFSAPTLDKFPANVTVRYVSSNEAVATVNATTGAVNIVGAGTAVITASVAGNADYTPASASYTLHVASAPVVHTISPTTEPLLSGIEGAPTDGKGFRIPQNLRDVTMVYSGSSSQQFQIADIIMPGETGISEPETVTISGINEMLEDHDWIPKLVWIANGSVAGQTLTYTE